MQGATRTPGSVLGSGLQPLRPSVAHQAAGLDRRPAPSTFERVQREPSSIPALRGCCGSLREEKGKPLTEGPEITVVETVLDNGKFGKRTVKFEHGLLARQAAGAVTAYIDDETMILSATTAGNFSWRCQSCRLCRSLRMRKDWLLSKSK